ncbi:MAG: NPCBM/NEW2 domain-containing protein [Planctomycetota bacterium]|nr:NPCBM/NEW2 domain-containing protein [Planctomycetota bacterium]
MLAFILFSLMAASWPSAGLPGLDEEGLAELAEASSSGAFRVETRSGEHFEGQLQGGQAGGLRLVVEGEDAEVPADDWALVWNLKHGEGRPEEAPDLVLLVAPEGVVGTGDRLWGRLLGGDEFGLRMRLDAGLEVEVPFDAVDRLLPGVDRPLDRLIDLAGGGFDDRLWRRRSDGGLDGVTGVLVRLQDRTLVLESALGELDFPAETVLGLVLADTEHPGQPLEGLPMTVRLMGGSLFEAALRDVSDGVFLFETQFATSLALPGSVIASLLPHRREGRMTPLSRLDPAVVEEWPALGGPEAVLFPWRRELSVSGQALRVGGLLRTTGLGVHANARLGYVVPEDVSGLRVTVGLVDEVFDLPAEASVTFEILVDGTSRASTGLFREGDAPKDLRVDGLEAGQLIELITLDAGDLDAGDRAAWVDGLFYSDA